MPEGYPSRNQVNLFRSAVHDTRTYLQSFAYRAALVVQHAAVQNQYGGRRPDASIMLTTGNWFAFFPTRSFRGGRESRTVMIESAR